MNISENEFLKNLKYSGNSIWGNVNDYGEQKNEKLHREKVANKKIENYFFEIAKHHSIPVMDFEIKKFLNEIPEKGIILDIGGCWGWHWRDIGKIRPDVKVIILDLIRENLLHAKIFLDELIQKEQVFLVHGNATSLEFENETFNGVWSVQTTQHIQNYSDVCNEIHRVLKPGSVYWDYGLNIAKLTKFIYKLFKKHYHLSGNLPGHNTGYRRVNSEVFSNLKKIFHHNFDIHYSEILFSPEFGLPIGGKNKSKFGFIDSKLSGSGWIKSLIARQCSFHIKK